ncbi:hypothetical protein D3C76_1408890 [compost metagenome]
MAALLVIALTVASNNSGCDGRRFALYVHPCPNAVAIPLATDIGGESRRDLITIGDQSIEHDRQVSVGNAPVAEEVLGALLQQALGDEEQAFDRGLGIVGERRVLLAEVHQVKRALFADHQQIAAQPGLELTGPGALLEVLGEKPCMPWREFLEVFGDGGRLRQCKTCMN